MTTPTQYRRFAEECRRLAQQVETDRHRLVLHEMASAWRRSRTRARKPAFSRRPDGISSASAGSARSAKRNQTCAICSRLARARGSLTALAISRHSRAYRPYASDFPTRRGPLLSSMPLTATRHRRRCSRYLLRGGCCAQQVDRVATEGGFRLRSRSSTDTGSGVPHEPRHRCDLIETSAKIAKTHGRSARQRLLPAFAGT